MKKYHLEDDEDEDEDRVGSSTLPWRPANASVRPGNSGHSSSQDEDEDDDSSSH
jgi:hypothetical protein